MLPFLKKDKQVAGLIMAKRKPDGSSIDLHSEENEGNELDSCSKDLMDAVKSGDSKAFSKALRAAFEILDSEDDKESPHTYDAQNQLAAKESR